MDWNGDGKIDGRDGALFHSEINKGGSGGGSSGGGDGFGCGFWLFVGIIVFQITKWIAEAT